MRFYFLSVSRLAVDSQDTLHHWTTVAAFQSRTKMPTGTSTFSETFLSTFAAAAGLLLPRLEGLL